MKYSLSKNISNRDVSYIYNPTLLHSTDKFTTIYVKSFTLLQLYSSLIGEKRHCFSG